MYIQEAREEYLLALKAGLKEQKALLAAGKDPYPAVLDTVLGAHGDSAAKDIGLVEIPTEQIAGVKSAGRITAFTASFLPLLDEESEFYAKWTNLCMAHLSEGIQDPIVCYEYLGKFYVQEGNKRVSVLRHFGAPRILAQVRRILPLPSDDPRILAYYEFLDFYSATGLYQIQFRRPGEYAKLLTALGKAPGEAWTQSERRTLSAYFQYFRDALSGIQSKYPELIAEDALLLWLQVYPYRDLGSLSASALKKTVISLREDLLALCQEQPVAVKTEPSEAEPAGILDRIISGTPSHVQIAFVHPLDLRSTWIAGHEEGCQYLQQTLAEQVTVRSYFHADTPEKAEQLLEQAVADGADVIFTTTPQLRRPTLRLAVKHPKVRFLNCAMDTPYPSIRSYYGRIHEAKFITGAIAGAMAKDDHIGYIGSYPILGEAAAINAFALGAQMTNPRATVHLRWSCLPGSPQEDFFRSGIRVVSNREVPTQDRNYLNFCSYGTYRLNDRNSLEPLASPCWVWGKFYEKVVRSILDGTWEKEKDKDAPRAVNYWWGMRSGMIDIELSDLLPPGVEALAQALRHGLTDGTLDPFLRPITAQNGEIKNDGSHSFTAEELLNMDWLCENVEGSIPAYQDLQPFALPMVRALGLHRDRIPPEKEESE